jgi:hypothetical protein
MKKNPFEKFADKILKQKDKGDALKKYSIDLSGVLGGGVDQNEIKNMIVDIVMTINTRRLRC